VAHVAEDVPAAPEWMGRGQRARRERAARRDARRFPWLADVGRGQRQRGSVDACPLYYFTKGSIIRL
jgi:hypothetical protein